MKRFTRILCLVCIVALAAPGVNAQQDQSGKDFDPVTRALSNKNPTMPDPNQPQAAPQLTPEQQAELQRQAQIKAIADKRAEIKKKYEEAQQARMQKLAAEKAAQGQKDAAIRQARIARIEETKQNRQQLADLVKEERSARTAYQSARKSAKGEQVKQIDDDYRKSEKDRQAKIKELRHPHFKSARDFTKNPNGSQPVGTTGMPGSISSGTGPNPTIH